MKSSQNRGFTIVELLIVIVVIAILAAVTVTSYSGIQDRAHDTAVRSDLGNAARKLGLNRVDSGHYPTANLPSGATVSLADELAAIGLSFSRNAYSMEFSANLLYMNADSGSEFAIIARSKSDNVFYYSSREGSVKEYTGSYHFPDDGYNAMRAHFNMYEADVAAAYEYEQWSDWAQ